MSLSLLMRVSAAYMGLWVLMMALVPEMIINDLFGVPVTQALGAQMQFTSVATAAIASMQWMVSSMGARRPSQVCPFKCHYLGFVCTT